MKWLCNLIQRRLPDYPDGELSRFWQRRVAAHLEGCSACRREWEELREVVDLYLAHPLPEPPAAFWEEFNRELHLKLAEANQPAAPARRGFRLPHYLAGAAALAGVMAIAVYLAPLGGQRSGPPVPGVQLERQATAPALGVKGMVLKGAPPPALAPPPEDSFSLATTTNGAAARQSRGEKNGLWAEDDPLNLDVDREVADLSLQEQEALKKHLEAKEQP